MAAKRIQRELDEMHNCDLISFRSLYVNHSDLLTWHGLIVPDEPPFNAGAFKIEIKFPADYPFKPPKIVFQTKIYHPNVDIDGVVCLPIITDENWRPSIKIVEVIQSLIALINYPQPENAIRVDVAHEYLKDRQKFEANAQAFTQKHAEPRPQ